jgi:hemerythrin-like metal-binding protein
MQWNSSYSIGVTKIDSQHKRLMQFATILEQGIKDGSAAGNLGRVLKALVDYTSYHFKDEEDLMRQLKFAGYEHHKELHKDLINEVRSILIGLSGGNPPSPEELVVFLKRWITEHIEAEDKKIGLAMEKIRKGLRSIEGDTAKLGDTPTHELEANLEKLGSFAAQQLITLENQQIRKKALIQKYTENFSPESVVEVIEEFEAVANLANKGLISQIEKYKVHEKWSRQLDLNAMIMGSDSIEDTIGQLQKLVDRQIISTETYLKFKNEVLRKP